MSQVDQNGLDIIVVGAGIAGLSAAIALRRASHKVNIFERSDLKNEVGAAIHLCPNASRVLLEWGFDAEARQLVKAKKTYIADGHSLTRVYENTYEAIEGTYGAAWYFAHRVDLHDELKTLATLSQGGEPATIHAGRKVVNYDAQNGSVQLSDGQTISADLVVAADGVHSPASGLVNDGLQNVAPTNQSAFRFLIPTSALAADPVTAPFVEDDDGQFKVFTGKKGNRIVWYPCRNNTVQNFVGIFHEKEQGQKEDWNGSADAGELLNEYSDFHPSLLAVLIKATTVRKWPLLFRSPIPSWHRSKLVLVGDAAHPMLPHQGQAGAQAIEDAVALGIFLDGLSKADLANDSALLSQRLQLFEEVRRNRASAMQIFSNNGQDQGEKVVEAVRPYVEGHIPRNPAEFIKYNFSYDVKKHSLEVLRNSEAVARPPPPTGLLRYGWLWASTLIRRLKSIVVSLLY